MTSFINLKNIDMLGLEMGFEYNKSTRYKTWFGSILTYFALISTIVISFMFGQELYQRKSPIVTSSNVFQTNNINLNVFKFWIGLTSIQKETPVNVTDYLDIYIRYFHYNITTQSSDYSLKLEPCTVEYFERYINLAGVLVSQNVSICPNLDQTKTGKYFIQNPAITYNSTSVIIYISKCNSTMRECPSDIDEIFDGLAFHLNYIDSYIDNTDYDNPIKYFMDSKTMTLSLSFLKKDFISFANSLYSSDNGWLFNDVNNTTYQGFVDYQSVVYTPNESNPLQIYNIFLQTGNLSYKSSRSYMKVQDLFAKIGGILNAFVIFVTVISYHYIKYRYSLDIINCLEIRSNSVNSSINKKDFVLTSNLKTINDKNEDNMKNIENDKVEENFDQSINNKNYITDEQSKIKMPIDEINDENISNKAIANSQKLISEENLPKDQVKINNLVYLSRDKMDSKEDMFDIKYSYCEYLFALCCCSSSLKNKYYKQIGKLII